MWSRVTLWLPEGGGGGCSQDAPLEIMSSLIARLLRAAQEDNLAEVKVPPDAGARRPLVVPEVGIPGRSQLSEVEQVMVCFSCRRPGHGVNRCSRVDTSFLFLPQGWSVDSEMASTGRYGLVELACGLLRETRDGPGGRVSLPDHRDQGTTDPAEKSVFLRLGETNRRGSCRWSMSMAPVGLQACKLFRHWRAIPQKYTDGITKGCRSWLTRC